MPIESIELLLSRKQFPGMTSVESEIARRWLQVNAAKYDRVDFNVRLGEGIDMPEGTDDATREFARLNTQKRADFVAWIGPQPTIVEIKPRVGLAAMGQLLGYRVLFAKQFPDAQSPALLAVGERAVQETEDILAAHGVALELV